MKYSVIIPSYNKALPLMLTLTAFETQTIRTINLKWWSSMTDLPIKAILT